MNNRFYITNQSGDYTATRTAILIGCEFAKQQNSRLVVITATRNSSVLENSISKEEIKNIQRKGIFNGVKTSLETLKTYSYSSINDVVVGLYLPQNAYDSIDSITGDSIIIATEFIEHELNDWKIRWNAIDIENPKQEQPKLHIDGIVKIALLELTASINLSSGITNSFDNNRAKTYIRALVKYYNSFNFDKIKSFLIREKWQSKDAKEFVDLLEKKYHGGRFKGGETTGLKKLYDRWLKESNN